MPIQARLALVLLAALLAACSARSPMPHKLPDPGPPSPAAEDVLVRALGLVGTPYRWGGNTPDSGFDCSGLIGYVYREAAGLRLPRSTREMLAMRAPGVRPGALRSGDLVFFATDGSGRVSHAGIYVGEGRFVHAPSSGGTVRLDRLADGYWQGRYLGARRVLRGMPVARQP
ncbi:peptidoglycan endopeptidase [Azotobacter chroococcum]|jgi:cell wall-associated NlpC family hydrolase|uniref:C40 family peptidase n=1 Tax=Azotobacter chroococcum TaxID=353 RepID=A0A4Q9VPQ5_9GAMM|nr:C40 family peptidase [Azotobacter chroococcum]OHC12391.1 MAG: hydrolase Nlp/P60 [Pseudomonadales bacterium GWC1_66_9]ASL27053.1 hydrolase Nlp/P60 [Azotobacter chroococcum]QQE87372.1 C40 family peptidase [Azotobacter chroococcum]TBW37470.1 peptidoglycan endopeptidase [Azotobacter chroococcum]TKD38133.1 NlpC/P60 family protein [Azotobacter chroococcum]